MLALSPVTLTNANKDIKIGDVKTEERFIFTEFNPVAPLIVGCCPSSQRTCQRASLTVLATAGSRLPLHQAQEALNTLKEAQIKRSVHTPSGAAAGECIVYTPYVHMFVEPLVHTQVFHHGFVLQVWRRES